MDVIDEIFSYVEERNNHKKSRLNLGKIESSEVNGYWGTTYFCTALVPEFYADKLFSSKEGAGHCIDFCDPIAINDEKDLFQEKYFVYGLFSDEMHLEPLVASWKYHNKTVYFPEIKFLRHYHLISGMTMKLFFGMISQSQNLK